MYTETSGDIWRCKSTKKLAGVYGGVNVHRNYWDYM
jgi:phage shock protein PspC (stress-responsive transcriptional regulator)